MLIPFLVVASNRKKTFVPVESVAADKAATADGTVVAGADVVVVTLLFDLVWLMTDLPCQP